MIRIPKRFRGLILVAGCLPVAWLAANSFSRSVAAASETVAPQPAFSEPGISPDGSTIAFVSGGDIWTIPSPGGEARLLISNPATESRPLYSPDGSRLAFGSTRDGHENIYVLTLATGEVRRLTYDSSDDKLDGWSRDGQWIYFSSGSHDLSYMNDIYRVHAGGGTPMAVSADVYANEFESAPSPDGSRVAFAGRSIASAQWWRKGHSHLDEAEIWLLQDTNPPSYQQVSDSGAKSLWPMWSGDGRSLYYVSDRSGAQNIWMQPIGGSPRPVTPFRDGRVLWPSITPDGRTIVFERDFGIWKLDTRSGKASPVPITRVGAPAGAAVEHLQLSNHFQELALSPDGKKVAFVVHGEVFAAAAKEGGEAARVTFTPAAAESEITWSPDSLKLAYVSDRSGTSHLFLYDFPNGPETQLTTGAGAVARPQFSPDGKQIAFERDGQELIGLDLASKQERVLATGHFDRPPFGAPRPFAWSPDGRWIAYMQVTARGFRNVFVVAAAGGDSQPASFLGNVFSGVLSWSPSGTYLLFDTGQRTEAGQVARVDLIPHAPKFREDEFRDLFKPEAPRPTPPAENSAPGAGGEAKSAAQATAGEKKPATAVESDFDGIRRRLSLLPIGLDVNEQTISRDGKWLLVSAEAAGQENLYVYSLDDLAKEPPVARQLTSTSAPKSDAQFSPDGKEVFYLEGGTIHAVSVESRQARMIGVSAEMDVDFAHEKMEMFEQAWRDLRDNFFDPNFNGADWNAVHAEYASRVAAAATPDEVRRLISLMVGELNASHLGINSPPGGGGDTATGRLGVNFDRHEYEANGRLRVSHVVPFGPADLAKEIHAGDYLLAMDGALVAPPVNLDALLDHTIGKRIVLRISSAADGSNARDVVVKPVTIGAEKELCYREWVEERRAYVEKASNGRLGYVHMTNMSPAALEQLFLDLDAQNQSKQGVVIDVRNNNGGFVNVYAIDVLARRGYLTMTPRGSSSFPARAQLGQRSLELPTILVTNQHSLSDAEDFTEGYRSLHLGKVVGEPTAGWIIYTSGTPLIDGSFLRLPFIKITAADGSPMEFHPRPVDVPVVRPIGESYTSKDSQLDVAVRELLKQIDAQPK
jgi:tricorn protease